MDPLLNDATAESWRAMYRQCLDHELPPDLPEVKRPQSDAALLLIDPALDVKAILKAVGRQCNGIEVTPPWAETDLYLPHRAGRCGVYVEWVDTTIDGLWPLREDEQSFGTLSDRELDVGLTVAEILLWHLEHRHRTSRWLATSEPNTMRAWPMAVQVPLNQPSTRKLHPVMEWMAEDGLYAIWGEDLEVTSPLYFIPKRIPHAASH